MAMYSYVSLWTIRKNTFPGSVRSIYDNTEKNYKNYKSIYYFREIYNLFYICRELEIEYYYAFITFRFSTRFHKEYKNYKAIKMKLNTRMKNSHKDWKV